MKQLIRKTLLVLLGGLLCGSAWGDTTIVGAEDNSDADYYASDHKARYSIDAGKTISIQFTVSTSTANGWGAWYAWAVNFWDGTLNAITVEPRNYGWEAGTENTRWTADWATYWTNNYPTDWETDTNFRDIIQGATVVTTIKRLGADVIIIYDITTTSNAKYRQYVVKSYGTGTQTLWFDLIVNHAHIIIDNDKTVISDTDAIQGELLGVENNTGGFGAGVRKDFTIAPNGTLKLHFKNYTCKISDYMNWAFEMEYDGKWCDVVTGGNNWGELNVGGAFSDVNWPSTTQEFLDKMDGADVVLTVVRSGAEVSISALHTPVSGASFTRNFTFTPTAENFATSNAVVRLLTDHSHIDLLPESIEIGATGWGTYVSEYNLDFSQAEDGLTAYKVTGKTGSAINKEKLTGIVPAGTPMLLSAETASETYTVPVATSAGTAIAENCLKAGKGAQVNSADDYVRYVMVNSSGTAKFKKIGTTGPTINTNRAYLEFASSGEAHELLSLDGDDVTAIKNIKVGSEDNVYYNLNGQRVLYPTKGLYIVNGKKVIIK